MFVLIPRPLLKLASNALDTHSYIIMKSHTTDNSKGNVITHHINIAKRKLRS